MTATELQLGPLRDVRVDVGSTAMPTLISLVTVALGGPAQGVPPHWARLIRRALPPQDAEAVRPVFEQRSVVLPDSLCRLGLGLPMSAQLEQLAGTESGQLVREVATLTEGGAVPRYWQPVLRRPRHWLEQYVAVMAAAWRTYAPLWKQSAALRARETERIGAAVVTGALDALLAGISPRARYAGDSLFLQDSRPYRVELGGRRVVLVPLASGSSASVFNLDEQGLVWFGYSLPGLGSLTRTEPLAADALGLLVGPIRATILRELARPVTMGALASAIDAGASTATYHCGQLAAAGLVLRERTGREVRVERTARGDALVDLLS